MVTEQGLPFKRCTCLLFINYSIKISHSGVISSKHVVIKSEFSKVNIFENCQSFDVSQNITGDILGKVHNCVCTSSEFTFCSKVYIP